MLQIWHCRKESLLSEQLLLLIGLLSYITVVVEESNVSTVVNGNIANQENKTHFTSARHPSN